jgi:predicted XRE-type DNA-binding protein
MTEIVLIGTGNVFANLGYADASERQTKVRLAMALVTLLRARKLRQRDAAAILGIPQPKVSALVNYRLDGFSTEKLTTLLTALDQDVDIVIRPRVGNGSGTIAVIAEG